MRRITREEKSAETHGFGDEAAQRRDAFFKRWPDDQIFRGFGIETTTQFIPECLVAPLLGLVIQWALNVVAAARGRTHRAQREATLVVRVNQFVRYWRRVGENAEPPERVDLFIDCHRSLHAGSARAMVAVTAGDEVALQFVFRAVL